MKSKFTVLFGFLIIVSICTACSGEPVINADNAEHTAAANESILRWNIRAEPDTLDPLAYDATFVSDFLYPGVIRWNPENPTSISSEEFGLISSWKMNDSQTSYTFHLNPEIHWICRNDEGELEKKRPVDSKDLQSAIQEFSGILFNQRPALSWRASWQTEEIEKHVTTLDEFTILFKFDKSLENAELFFGEYFSQLVPIPVELTEGLAENRSGGMGNSREAENSHDEWQTDSSIILAKNSFYQGYSREYPESNQVAQPLEDANPVFIKSSNQTNPMPDKISQALSGTWDTNICFRSDAAYYLEEWKPGESITLEKNPFYPEPDSGLPDTIRFTWERQEKAMQEFAEKELDVIEIGYEPFMIDEWQKGEFLKIGQQIFIVNPDLKYMAQLQGLMWDRWMVLAKNITYKDLFATDSTALTYQNPGSVETYQKGNYNLDSKEEIKDPTFNVLADALESGKVIILKNLSWEGSQDFPDVDTEWVLTGENRISTDDGIYSLTVINKSGYDVNIGIDQMGKIIIPGAGEADDSWYVEIYKPLEPICTYGTVYIAMNLDKPPYNDIEVRKSLAAITDRKAYMLDVQGNTEGLSYSLIPQQLLGEYSYLGDNYTTSFTQSTQVDLSSLGGVELSYCGSCEGSDVYAGGVTSVWGKNLGSQVRAKAISHEQYQQPIKGQDLGMTFAAGSTNSWFDFAYQWVKEGWIMVPESEYDAYMRFVEATALESDPNRQAQMILEINRLLVEEYISVIPLYWTVYCE